MRKLLKKQDFAPTQIITDKLKSYHKAIRTLGVTAVHIDSKKANNRAESSHLLNRIHFKQARDEAFNVWAIEITAA